MSLSQVALPLRRLRGQRTHAARLQLTKKNQQQSLVPPMRRISWTSQLEHGETCSAAEATRGHDACVRAVFGWVADPGVTTEPRGLTEGESRTAALFTAAAVPGRSAALDVCVASADALAEAQRTQPSRSQNFTLSIPNSRLLGSKTSNTRMSGQQTGDRTRSVTRTLQCAADIASCRNGQHMSAKSFEYRWRHDIQIAFFRRRATMTGAVFPNPSARAEWLLAGIIAENNTSFSVKFSAGVFINVK